MAARLNPAPSRPPEIVELRRLNARDLEPLLQEETAAWWETAKYTAADDKKYIEEASLYGGRMALKWTAAVPAAMAVLYLILLAYFKMIGGYKRVEIPTGSMH